jgi:hypothetical protein
LAFFSKTNIAIQRFANKTSSTFLTKSQNLPKVLAKIFLIQNIGPVRFLKKEIGVKMKKGKKKGPML